MNARKAEPELPTALPTGKLRLSRRKLRMLRPDLFTPRAWVASWLHRLGIGLSQPRYLTDQLKHGENRAAMVISLKPLLIAAYSQEIDCVAMLEFPTELAQYYRLKVGTRLLSLNINGNAPEIQSDLIPGPGQTQTWQLTHPLIADFVSMDYAEIRSRKREIAESEWQRAYYLGLSYLEERKGLARSGLPMFAAMEAQWS